MKYLVREKYVVKNDDLYLDWGFRDFFNYIGKNDIEQNRPVSSPEPSKEFVELFGFDTREEADEVIAERKEITLWDRAPNHVLLDTEVVLFDIDSYSNENY